MGKVDRLLCHPCRVFVNEICDVLVKEDSRWDYQESKPVVIPVDSLVGNPDPYVFHRPWLYGYCRNYNMPNNAGQQSIIIFGTYLKNPREEAFLVDTVFVVRARYEWLGKVDGYSPSEAFKKHYPYSKDSKLYKDFIMHRVESKHHVKAKAIFAAEHIEKENYYNLIQIPHKRSDNFYSFIPLKYEQGIYKLIDILPIIKQKDPALLDTYDERRNRLYNLDSNVVNIIDYLIKEANTLVVRTSGTGMPQSLDMNLQRKYYKHIYNIVDEGIIEESCKEKCYSIGEEE